MFMNTQEFTFDLPEALIAKFPLSHRSGSRLLCLDGQTGQCRHQQFSDITQELKKGDLLVFNNTRVIPARVYGRKATGGKLELLIERVLSNKTALAHVKASKSPKVDSKIFLDNGYQLTVTGRKGALFALSFSDDIDTVLHDIGHMPLPPYIDRADNDTDRERYQTVYSEQPGAVAAPTAGLHFDQPLLDQLAKMGVDTAFVTLHVGAGTFQPVRVDNVSEHLMHQEWMQLDATTADTINKAKAAGRRVISVGTTSVRCLETAASLSGKANRVVPFQGDTDIFIYPGFEFQIVDRLLTNFHLPESTLLMLVSAFAGFKHTLDAYKEAVDQQYRFFSYGDAMLIDPNPNAIIEARARWPEIKL